MQIEIFIPWFFTFIREMSSKTRVMICGDLAWAHDECKELFNGLADVIVMDSSDKEAFLRELKPGGKYAGIVGTYRHNLSADKIGIFDAQIVEALAQTGVKWIAHNGAGYDQIDVQACKKHGIRVSNTPGAVDDATATTALYLVLSTLRNFSVAERNLRDGKWKSGHQPGLAHDATGRTLGVLGMGGIGRRLAELVHAFPMKVIYHNRKPSPEAPEWAEYVADLDDFLGRTDVLSVHVPLNANTVGLVGEQELRKLKKGSIVVNTARGKVIDEEALIRALEDGHLGAVGLDVYPDEPNVNPRLLDFTNATLLPHMGTETCDSQRKMEVRALTNLRDFLTQGAGKDLIWEHK